MAAGAGQREISHLALIKSDHGVASRPYEGVTPVLRL